MMKKINWSSNWMQKINKLENKIKIFNNQLYKSLIMNKS